MNEYAKTNEEISLDTYKKESAKAAKQLGYDSKVIDQIKNAESEAEIQKIMITARHKKFG
jgi:hypothetical protein